MADIIIKDVPEGAVDLVKDEAIDIIERFLRRQVKPDIAQLNKCKDDVDASAGFKDNGTAGIDTTFVDADGNTITVSGGIIVSKVAP